MGGDQQFPFNPKMTGDEVHGNSGLFRHFLSEIIDQLHSPTLNLLVLYRGTVGNTAGCEEALSHQSDLEIHIRSFMCHVCTKVFPSNARLDYHVQCVHSLYKPYHCSKYTKNYKRKAELLEHEEMKHSTHFNYSCNKCGKQFYGKKNLAFHMKTHHTEKKEKHICNVCGYRFAKIKFR